MDHSDDGGRIEYDGGLCDGWLVANKNDVYPIGYDLPETTRSELIRLPSVRSAKEIRDEVRAVRERVRGFSGYWIGEAAAAIYALEWVNEKRDAPPSKDIGSPGGGHEKVAASLLKLGESAPKPADGRRKTKDEKQSKPAKKRK